MAQHDYDIANQTAPNLRSDLNNVLAAIVSQNSGSTAPSSTFANMIWYDTANNILKMRNEADDAWINVAYVNQADNTYAVLEGTKIRNASGTEIGEVGSGGLALLETQTASTSATLDFTNFDNTKYANYVFTFEDVLPATDDQDFLMRLSSDGGSTFASTAGDYGGDYGGSDTAIIGTTSVASTLLGVSGTLSLYNPLSGSRTSVVGTVARAVTVQLKGGSTTVDFSDFNAFGYRDATVVTDAVRFLFESGNIASGVIRMYGVLK